MPNYGCYVAEEAQDVLKAIQENLNADQFKYSASAKNAYKLKFNAVQTAQNEENEEDAMPIESAEVQIQLLRADDDMLFVEFQKKGGSCRLFREIIGKYTNHINLI